MLLIAYVFSGGNYAALRLIHIVQLKMFMQAESINQILKTVLSLDPPLIITKQCPFFRKLFQLSFKGL